MSTQVDGAVENAPEARQPEAGTGGLIGCTWDPLHLQFSGLYLPIKGSYY